MNVSLLDPTCEPDAAAFRAAVGSAADLWMELERWLVEAGATWHPAWGGKAEGWYVRARRAGRPLVTLTPAHDGFTACVVLGVAATAEAASVRLGPATRRIFDGARRYPDGTWLFIPVQAPADLADVLALLELKLPVRLRRVLAAAS